MKAVGVLLAVVLLTAGDGGAFQVASVRVGAKELVFLFPWDDGAVDPALVTSITTRPWSMEMHGGC